MARFEIVSKFKDANLPLPERKTAQSAGYDLVAAQDTIIPAYNVLLDEMLIAYFEKEDLAAPLTLNEMANLTKKHSLKPTLVSTGVKCQLDPNTYLELSMRSSAPLKYWLVLANGVGIIDADYYNNPDNEGEIFLQIINLGPTDILIQKGEAIGQGIIKPYLTTEDDAAAGQRIGGFGSTSA